MNHKIVVSVTLTAMIIMCITMLVCEHYYNKPKREELPKTGIWLQGQNNSWKPTIIIIKDYNKKLQWDAIQSGHSIIILPGTEKPLEK